MVKNKGDKMRFDREQLRFLEGEEIIATMAIRVKEGEQEVIYLVVSNKCKDFFDKLAAMSGDCECKDNKPLYETFLKDKAQKEAIELIDKEIKFIEQELKNQLRKREPTIPARDSSMDLPMWQTFIKLRNDLIIQRTTLMVIS